jgi:Tat protein secretion system quality control protein TatD with DNase activity
MSEADVLGEVGLDYKYAKSPEDKAHQNAVLSRLLNAAGRAGKSINLHSRWAQRPTLEAAVAYKRTWGLNALMHWFTSSKKLIRICAEEKIFVSVGPSILLDGPACEVCLHIPDPLLLVETDSPVPFGGEPAEPAWAYRVLERLSVLRGRELSELAEDLNENFDRYLHLA